MLGEKLKGCLSTHGLAICLFIKCSYVYLALQLVMRTYAATQVKLRMYSYSYVCNKPHSVYSTCTLWKLHVFHQVMTNCIRN